MSKSLIRQFISFSSEESLAFEAESRIGVRSWKYNTNADGWSTETLAVRERSSI